VRLGSLSGKGNRKRQKKVDVLLAVEALDHAFRKNMAQVCLITGDLDFSPLVESLVKLGTYVTVSYVASSGISSTLMSANVILPDGAHAKVTCLSGFDRCGPIESFHPELLPPDSKKCINGLGADGNSAVFTCTMTDLGFYDATREGNKLTIVVPSGTVQYHIESSW
jgi:hypothetical protein